MAHVQKNSYEKASGETKKIWDQQVRDHGRMTNMKQTLAHSSNALRSYMEWYPLKDEIAEFTGERAAIIFAHAISVKRECLICSTFFRRILIDWGENPDELILNEDENLLVEYGRHLAANPGETPPTVFEKLKSKYTEKQIVSLTAFAGIMIATNLFNDALQVELDSYLHEYR